MESRYSTDIPINPNFKPDRMANLMMNKLKCKGGLNEFHKKNGIYQYVVSRSEDNPDYLYLCIGKGNHYVIASGVNFVVMAGEIEFKNGEIIYIDDRSGTYHLDIKNMDQNQKEKAYKIQKIAMAQVGFPNSVISALERPYDSDFVPDNYSSKCCYDMYNFFSRPIRGQVKVQTATSESKPLNSDLTPTSQASH